MFCSRCGAQNDADAGFCRACGTALTPGGGSGPGAGAPPGPPPPPAPGPPPPPPPPPGGSGIFGGPPSGPPPGGGFAGGPGPVGGPPGDPRYGAPYGAPYGGAPGPSGPRADFGSRAGAVLIDSALLFVAFLVLALILRGAASPLVWLGGIGYYAFFEGSPSGQTVGKRATNIRVISSIDGAPIGFGRGLLRYVGKLASGLALGLGYLWMLWDPERQTWQDKIASTYVVPTSAYPVQSWP